MKVPFALFVEAANHGPERVLNIMGSFDTLAADSFPVVRPQLSGVVWFEGEKDDVLPAHINLRLMSESGDIGLWERHVKIDREPGKEDRLVKGQIIFQAFGIVIPEPGDYFLFVQDAWGQDLYRRKLEVQLRKPAQSA